MRRLKVRMNFPLLKQKMMGGNPLKRTYYQILSGSLNLLTKPSGYEKGGFKIKLFDQNCVIRKQILNELRIYNVLRLKKCVLKSYNWCTFQFCRHEFHHSGCPNSSVHRKKPIITELYRNWHWLNYQGMIFLTHAAKSSLWIQRVLD